MCTTLFCTFACRCFAQLQCKTLRNFLFTCIMEELSYVFLFTYISTAARFHLGGY